MGWFRNKIIMKDKNIGFIGLGNLGKNLANSILLGGFNLFVHDLIKNNGKNLIQEGAHWCDNIESLVDQSTIIVTCLPNPKAVSIVMESSNGIIKNINSNHLLIECSTTDEEELIRLSKLVNSKSASYIDAPLSGGEWRSKKGNISVLVSGQKESFNRALPVLKEIGYEIVYLGEKLGSASTVKVLTNYLASINLLAIGEVLMICKKYNLDLKAAYEAIRASSGNSFVHTSEAQLILSRSFDAQFTMDLICKDLGLVEKLRNKFNVPSEIIPLVERIFIEGKNILGEKEFSTAIVKLLEKQCNEELSSTYFPKQLIDNEPRKKGIEIKF